MFVRVEQTCSYILKPLSVLCKCSIITSSYNLSVNYTTFTWIYYCHWVFFFAQMFENWSARFYVIVYSFWSWIICLISKDKAFGFCCRVLLLFCFRYFPRRGIVYRIRKQKVLTIVWICICQCLSSVYCHCKCTWFGPHRGLQCEHNSLLYFR